MPRLSILIPVYNEVQTIEKVLERVFEGPLPEGIEREVIEGVELKSNRFTIEPELTAKVAKKKARVFEVPIA